MPATRPAPPPARPGATDATEPTRRAHDAALARLAERAAALIAHLRQQEGATPSPPLQGAVRRYADAARAAGVRTSRVRDALELLVHEHAGAALAGVRGPRATDASRAAATAPLLAALVAALHRALGDDGP